MIQLHIRWIGTFFVSFESHSLDAFSLHCLTKLTNKFIQEWPTLFLYKVIAPKIDIILKSTLINFS